MSSITSYSPTSIPFLLLNTTVDPEEGTVEQIKYVAYSIVAFIVVEVGMVGNLLSLLVLNRPNLKGVMCVLIDAVPALFDISQGFNGGSYATAFYQAHLKLPTPSWPALSTSSSA